MTRKLASSSQLLKQIQAHDGKTISIAEIVTIFREGGFSLLLIVFAAPLALPLPALGVAQVLAVPILILAVQLMLGRKSLWMPSRIAHKRVQTKNLNNIIDKAIPWLEKIEHYVKPRLSLFSSRFGSQLTGLMCLLCAISVALPFPFSNTVPSMGIVLMSIGLLERDGFAIISGIIVGALGIMLACAVMIFGIEAVMNIIEAVKGWFL